MKTTFMAALVTILAASTSFAQETSTTQFSKPNDTLSSQGFRVGIVKPMLTIALNVSNSGFSESASEKIDQALGFSLGYAILPIEELGWTVNAAYIDVKNNGTDAGIVRVDGNMAYAFTKLLNLKGGLNISKLTGSGADKFTPGFGFQASFGLQFTKNFGLDVGYTEMNQSGSFDDGIKIDSKISGLEIGMNGTF